MPVRPRSLAAPFLLAAVACAGEPLPVGGGVELPDPIPKHDFTLTATDGRPWRFREATAGRLTFLFFGYTSCPDVCPVQMAGLGAALRTLPPERARELVTVFVATDPPRDSAQRVRRWLDAFNRDFVGLVGAAGEVRLAEEALELGAEPRGGPLPHRIDVAAQKLGLEAGDEPLGQLAQPAAALGEPLPFRLGEEAEGGGLAVGRRLAEVQVGDRRGPRVDVGR